MHSVCCCLCIPVLNRFVCDFQSNGNRTTDDSIASTDCDAAVDSSSSRLLLLFLLLLVGCCHRFFPCSSIAAGAIVIIICYDGDALRQCPTDDSSSRTQRPGAHVDWHRCVVKRINSRRRLRRRWHRFDYSNKSISTTTEAITRAARSQQQQNKK